MQIDIRDNAMSYGPELTGSGAIARGPVPGIFVFVSASATSVFPSPVVLLP